ncbi:DUF805 domain-containing protein [Leucothrix pacifica]|uniref:DUF805 domain-containing protein n=1 Tax=Leucothrix pacifica TaxID=1247513 RepID=A0A317C8U5_9GAMM|nr:DUF805 domain-containing protein [Leucothrix pacifica]PWQ94966.1 hypothetical protein DKW60_16315 [Leucothrix pacifica]
MDSTVDFEQYQRMVKPSSRYSEVRILSADGRVGRFEYFFYSLVIPFLVFWIVAALAGIASHFGELGGAIAYVLLAAGFCAAVIIYVQLTIQRCHDFNANGWVSLLVILPLACILFWIIPGNTTVNRYGEPTRPPSSLLKVGAGLVLLILVAAATFLGLNYFGL